MTEPPDPQSSRARILALEQECERLERELLYWKNGTRILELETRLREAEDKRELEGEQWKHALAKAEAERDRLRTALSITHGTAQAMADRDPWIAQQCGMLNDGEAWYVSTARQALEGSET